MPRPKLNEATKKCREELRALALWTLSKGQVAWADLLAWLKSNVDIGWGRKGRPTDLGDPEQEAGATIRHLTDQGNCEATGKAGHKKVRLVQQVRALEKSIERLSHIEDLARVKARKRLRDGDWIAIAEVFPSSWSAPIIKQVGKRLWHAVEETVLQRLKRDPAYQVRTVERGGGKVVEEVRLAPPSQSASPEEAATPDSEVKTEPVGHEAEGHARQAAKARKKLKIVMLPVCLLYPNGWNPNTMTEEEKRQLLEEVLRRGGPPKPIVVRHLKNSTYEIVDGEHNWAAVKEAGYTEVACEVIDVDDFEAMRQTYVRNQHGSRDPLRTGRIFRRMLTLHGMSVTLTGNSQRKFAREININETTLRNYLLYARGAEVRHRYAPDTTDETIGNLSVGQVRKYLQLPENRRNEWLDRGAKLDEAANILAEASAKPEGPKEQAEDRVTATPAPTEETNTTPTANESEENTEQPSEESDDGEDSGEPTPTPVVHEKAETVEPLSQAEQEVVSGVLKAYRDGRTLVRNKILSGLGAYPDAITFFRRMLKGGS